MTRIGILVNPDAGLGGRLGYKGTDGRAAEARAAGAVDRSGPRMTDALSRFSELLSHLREAPHLMSCSGRMGSDWIPAGISFEEVVRAPAESTAEDTRRAVSELLDANIDLLFYAGGDGTTRDIVAALEEAQRTDLPLVGVPTGVKMHSGCFAATPRAAAEVLAAWLAGDLMLASTEVMDLDEEAYREGEWKVRMYAEVQTPSSPRWMQGAKMRVAAAEEEEVLEGLAAHVGELAQENPGMLIIWGSGGTLRAMSENLGMQTTLLGIDASRDGVLVGRDLAEDGLLELLDGNGSAGVLLLLSPMGGQGFLIGRGNLQLSPEVLRAVGVDNILGVATPGKLAILSELRIDSGDSGLDADIRERRYLRVLQGFRTTRLIKVAD
ncbi:MAG: ATP-NAD kinase [Candidatus Neomarinimicrobiota bacterium]|nr:MAG: ATP-NAD kinase [Candidatus Neomarinimicrobiota bacterium]